MYVKLSAGQLSRADVAIRPRVGHIGSSDLERRHEAIMGGEKAALAELPAIQQMITRLRQEGRLD